MIISNIEQNLDLDEGGNIMLKIKFRYKDKYSNWEWREQMCIVPSVEECIKIYGLGVDCEYEILSVEPY